MTIAVPRLVRVPAAERGVTIGDFLVPIRVGERMSARVRHVVLVIVGALAITLSANVAVSIPGTPVPVTAQTFGVLVVGGALGFRRGALAALLYLALGIVGLPVYAGHAAGIGTFGSVSGGLSLAPTGGYLLGFVVGAAIVGRFAELGWDRTVAGALAAFTVGTVAIYAIGLPWLAVALGVPVRRALELGLLPFLVGDILKVVVAAGIFPVAWWVVSRRSIDR